jgi:hypothetical protein
VPLLAPASSTFQRLNRLGLELDRAQIGRPRGGRDQRRAAAPEDPELRRSAEGPVDAHGSNATHGTAGSRTPNIVGAVSVRHEQQQDRWSVAVAAVTCGRLTQAEVVRATRGDCAARADQYGVNVTESAGRSLGARDPIPELVVEHWGGDAEMLAFESTLRPYARRSDPRERARVAAETIRHYDLDSLKVTFPDGAELSADRVELVLRGPRVGRLRRRDVLIRAALSDLL